MVERIVQFSKTINFRFGIAVVCLQLLCALVSCSADEALTPENANAELMDMVDAQQLAREALDSVVAATGWNSPAAIAASRHADLTDSTNMARLDTYVAEHGWPGRTSVGQRATLAAFLIAQHAELEVQLRYLPILREASEKDEILPAWLAMFEDRVLMRQDQPQIYGTQVWEDPSTGALGLYPIQDTLDIDARRAAVGLGPLDDYLRGFGLNPDSTK